MELDLITLTTRETAHCLGCSEGTVYQLIKTGRLIAYKDEGRRPWRIPEEAVTKYRQERLALYNQQ